MVVLLSLFDRLGDLSSSLARIPSIDRHFGSGTSGQLDISIFVVVDVDLEIPLQGGITAWLESNFPNRSPATVPEVAGIKFG